MLRRTLLAVLEAGEPVVVIVDGSTDGSGEEAQELAREHPLLEVRRLPVNGGKGAAVLEGLRVVGPSCQAALVMDADGQHPAGQIREFFELSDRHPGALIAGVPVFGPDAPRERVWGRRVGNSLAWLETLGMGPRDALFGFRVYPVAATRRVLEPLRWGRGFDFDTVAAVRLVWEGVPVVNAPARVFYPPKSGGGVSHFRYVRDNTFLAVAHARLLAGMLARLPQLLALQRQRRARRPLNSL